MGEVVKFPHWRDPRSIDEVAMHMITNYEPPDGEAYLRGHIGLLVATLRSNGWPRSAAEREGELLRRAVKRLLADLRARAPRNYA